LRRRGLYHSHMLTQRRRPSITAWFAIAVLMMAALLPSLSMAARMSDGRATATQALQELCSAGTLRMQAALSGGQDPSQDSSMAMGADCVWCQLAAQPLVPVDLPHALGPVHLPTCTGTLTWADDAASAETGRASHDAQPRAPPVHLS